MPEGLADQETFSVAVLLANTQWALRQALAAATDFRRAEFLKLPAPRSEAGKVGSVGYMPCWKCSAHTNISRAARSWSRQRLHPGPRSCMLRAWSWEQGGGSARAAVAMAHGCMQTLGFVSLPAGTVRFSSRSGSKSQDLPLASCSGVCLLWTMVHRASQHPVLDPAPPPDLPQTGRRVSRAWLEWLSSASSVRPSAWDLAGVEARRVPSADAQLYRMIDPVTEGAGS